MTHLYLHFTSFFMKQIFITSLIISFSLTLGAQSDSLKTLDHSDFLIWNTIQNAQINAAGDLVIYRTVPGEGDPLLHIHTAGSSNERTISRVSKSKIDYDGEFFYGLITPHRDSLRQLERKKVDKKEWPGDTLFVMHQSNEIYTRIPNVKEYKSPAKFGDWLAYSVKEKSIEADTTDDKKRKRKEALQLIVRQLSTGIQDTLNNVKDFVWAEKAPVLLAITESRDSSETAGVAFWSNHEWRYIKKEKGEYKNLSLPQDGNQVAFIGNLDTTKATVEPWELFYYDFKTDSAQSIAGPNKSALPLISKHADLNWSDDGKYLFYGRAEKLLQQDTTLLEDEIVDVEVWSTDDPVLYTMQNINKSKDEKKSYDQVYDTQSQQHKGICSPAWESATYAPDRNSRFIIVSTGKPYDKEVTWMGNRRRDLAKVDLLTGAVIPIRKGILTYPRISPGGLFAYGYSEIDSTWWTYEFGSSKFSLMPTENLPEFYDELNDMPDYPNSYGAAGWVEGDQSLVLYDRYDLWAWSGKANEPPIALTDGRETHLIYRYIRTDDENKSMPVKGKWLIHTMDNLDKSTGYTWFYPEGFQLDSILSLTRYQLTKNVEKARLADVYLYTKESFSVFPDLLVSQNEFKTDFKISDANPQQKDYAWGTNQLYYWQDFEGNMRTGQLVLPPGYDTLRSYPMIVNFYERSSDNLHDHPTPAPHRSTINYAFYASRGYVIFNPDISYKTGMPGESAYQIVMSGVTSLIKDRIADPENIGLQGHSWGGYQIAYIVTRTNMFKCAESGAPVVNMTSAYTGIRDETGMPRLFQYERTQSRLGATLWEDPKLYISNSPQFKMDKIETPMLILHNEQDGHVPVEQGIEFYLALRRLNKPAWLLNYRGEPHWPLKWQNRKDFNIRMAQFFDHYLKGAPMPEWMSEGIPAIERGINTGLKLKD